MVEVLVLEHFWPRKKIAGEPPDLDAALVRSEKTLKRRSHLLDRVDRRAGFLDVLFVADC